jgi:hypothetical protein
MNFGFVKKPNNYFKLLHILMYLWFGLCFGCAVLLEKKPPEEKVLPVEEWDLQSYAQFLQQNMKAMNEQYSTNYIPYDFVVDTENGSTLVQNLVNFKSVSPILDQLKLASLEQKEQILKLYQYVLAEYDYVLDAYHWPTVEETLKSKRGDCKGLSLLLMSLWTAAGFNTHAAISNGHMWANVYYDREWHIFELDNDPERSKVYSIPGFYDYPLFKIYRDQTYKRKPRNYKDPVNSK